MIKRAIVNFSTNSGWYKRGQKRLGDSLTKQGYGGDLFFINEEKVIGSPKHTDVPYAFKPFAMNYLRAKGYQQVLWLDASIWAVKPLDTIWQWMEEEEGLMEESGHWLGAWTNMKALNNMSISRDEAMTIPMYSAGMTGLDLRKERANQFLDEWLAFAKDGETFKGVWWSSGKLQGEDQRFKGHRHDMSVASFLAYKHQFKLSTGGNFLAYVGPGYSKPKENAVFYLQPC